MMVPQVAVHLLLADIADHQVIGYLVEVDHIRERAAVWGIVGLPWVLIELVPCYSVTDWVDNN